MDSGDDLANGDGIPTSSIGLTTAVLAKQLGMTVLSTTRKASKREMLQGLGVDHVIIDEGASLEGAVRRHLPDGVDRVLELIGPPTLRDSMYCCRGGGIVCMTGCLSGVWVWERFDPFLDIPNGVCLTSYGGGSDDVTVEALQAFVSSVERGEAPSHLDRTFALGEIQEAHRYMEANRARGKLVVVT